MQEVGNLRWNRLVQKAAIHLPKMITDANPYGTSNSTFGIISPLVHSEKDFASRKLDEGRMAHPPSGCPVPRRQLWSAQYCSLKFRIPVSGKRPLPSYRVAEVLRLCFLSQAHFALQQRIFSTPRNENTPNVLNGRKYHARELSGVYSGCSTAHFHAIHGSDLPRLSQADGVQGQKAHPIQQRTDGSDLSLRHLRCRDQEDSQGVVEIEWAAALIGRPTEIELRNRLAGVIRVTGWPGSVSPARTRGCLVSMPWSGYIPRAPRRVL